MNLFDYFIPPTSPVQGPNQSQFGQDFTKAVNTGASVIGGAVNQGLYNLGNFLSGGKLAQNHPQAAQPLKTAVQTTPHPTPWTNPTSTSAQPTPTPTRQPVAPTPSYSIPSFNPQNVLGAATQAIISKLARPTATPTPSPTVAPTPTPTPMTPQRQMMIDTIQQFYKNWGSPPAATLAGAMVDQSQKYPILQQHPEYLPVTSVLESGGMRNMPPKRIDGFYPSNENRQYNGFGWGLNPAFQFNPSSPEDVIAHVASGVGTKPQYAPFRQSGDIADLARVYSPYDPVSNPYGGEKYVNNYNQIADVYRAAEAEIKRRRGIK